MKLVVRNLLRRPLRTLLTVAALVVALMLVCILRSLVTTLESSTAAASSRRLVVQSAVSLFVDLPLSYAGRIVAVEGVARVSKWHWFGAYYKDEANQFAQFAVDPDRIFEIYPEFALVQGSQEDFASNLRGCVIGEGLSERYGWQLGDTVPLLGMIYPHPEGFEVAWEFEVEAIYRPTVRNFDKNAMLFQWDYFERTMEGSGADTPGVGTFVVEVADGTDPTAVMASVDALFEAGPKRVQTTSEAEFTKQFVSMLGNIPLFLTTIGGAVLAAILLACINTMLMAAREQTHDLGVMKALGFGDRRVAGLLLAQSLALCLLGGGLGVLIAKALEPGMAAALAAYWPGYAVEPSTVALGIGLALAIGLVAGLAPAWRASRLGVTEALAATD